TSTLVFSISRSAFAFSPRSCCCAERAFACCAWTTETRRVFHRRRGKLSRGTESPARKALGTLLCAGLPNPHALYRRSPRAEFRFTPQCQETYGRHIGGVRRPAPN